MSFLMMLKDFQGHSPIASQLQVRLFVQFCSIWRDFNRTERRAVPLQ